MPLGKKVRPDIFQPDQQPSVVPRLNSAREAQELLHCSPGKWKTIKDDIEYVMVGARRFWTDRAIVAYLRRQTRPQRPRK